MSILPPVDRRSNGCLLRTEFTVFLDPTSISGAWASGKTLSGVSRVSNPDLVGTLGPRLPLQTEGSQRKESKNNMRKTHISLFSGILALGLVLPMATAYGQSQPSAKVTAKTANLVLLPETTGTGGWQTLLANTMKTANQKDLFIGASFEVGLYTRTLVRS